MGNGTATPEKASKTKKRSNEIDMIEGPLLGKILLFALPLALSSFLQQFFNTADCMVIGQLVGGDALAGVGACTPVINMLVNLFTGLSVGANVVIAIYVGRREEEKVSAAVHTAMFLALVSGVVLIALGLTLGRPLLALIGTPEGGVMDEALVYIGIYFACMPFFMLYNFGSAVLRSKGDTRRPLWCLAAGSALNVVLDLVSVVVLGMGLPGVAWSTFVSYGVSAGLIVACLLREEGPFRLDVRKLKPDARHLTDILKMGVPAGLQGAVFSVSNLVIQKGINGFGSDAMAGSAAALNFEYFTYFMVAAFASACVTFMSQNYAVKKYDRCKRVVRLCMACALVSSSLLVAVFIAGNEFFVGLFATTPDAIAYGMRRMVIVEAFEWMTCSYEVAACALRGMGRSILPTVIILCGTVGLRLAYFFTVFMANQSFGLLMNVYVGTWVPTGVAMLLAYYVVQRKAFAAKPAPADR